MERENESGRDKAKLPQNMDAGDGEDQIRFNKQVNRDPDKFETALNNAVDRFMQRPR